MPITTYIHTQLLLPVCNQSALGPTSRRWRRGSSDYLTTYYLVSYCTKHSELPTRLTLPVEITPTIFNTIQLSSPFYHSTILPFYHFTISPASLLISQSQSQSLSLSTSGYRDIQIGTQASHFLFHPSLSFVLSLPSTAQHRSQAGEAQNFQRRPAHLL